ncbi:hypothetical protein ACFO4L_12190 [Bacillus daqingensis]|uniref:Uncharacterized protein n=1 Tax=Bacillus daqingensis TaxID=872396 RepID=A0ABV9NVE0_9BACI
MQSGFFAAGDGGSNEVKLSSCGGNFSFEGWKFSFSPSNVSFSAVNLSLLSNGVRYNEKRIICQDEDFISNRKLSFEEKHDGLNRPNENEYAAMHRFAACIRLFEVTETVLPKAGAACRGR